MPLEAIAINDFNTPLMRETITENELQTRLHDLYAQDKRLHDFDSGEQAIMSLSEGFTHGDLLYVGMFNDKPICAIACSFIDKKIDDKEHRHIYQLAMHRENLNRGIEEQFIKLIIQAKSSKKITFCSKNKEISTLIDKFQK